MLLEENRLSQQLYKIFYSYNRDMFRPIQLTSSGDS
jgi:hypothetical protein